MRLLLGILAAAVVLYAAAAVQAQEAARVTATATEIEQDGEEYVRVDVTVEDVDDLGGFEFIMSWSDALTLDVTDESSVQRGDFLGSSGREVLCEAPVLEPFAIRYACVTLGTEPRAGAAGDGLLASVFLRPQRNGNASIQFTGAQLSTPPGERIPAEWEEGEVSITSDDSNALIWIVVGAGAAVIAVAVLGGGIAYYLRNRPGEQLAA